MRPRFALPVECEAEEFMEVLRDGIELHRQTLTGSTSRRHAILRMPEPQRRFWSPQLTLAVEERNDDVKVQALFSPHPHVWTGFVCVYALLFMIGLSGLMYGLAEISLDRTPWGMLAPIVTAIVAAFVYGATFIGQGLGAEEMRRLRNFLDECVDEAATRSRELPGTARDSSAL
jgi:hypothetical protein